MTIVRRKWELTNLIGEIHDFSPKIFVWNFEFSVVECFGQRWSIKIKHEKKMFALDLHFAIK